MSVSAVLVAALALAFGASSLYSSAKGNATSSPVISAPGMWTLDRLGFPAQQIPVDHPVNIVHLGFSLPPGVAAAAARCYDRKSSKTCFLIHYHFLVHFDPAAQPGFAYISASTNQFTSSQVPFEVTRSQDQLAINWSTLGLIRGYDPHVSTSPDIEVRDVNYLQIRGLKDGENTLDYVLEIPGSVGVKSLEVLPDSGLEWSHVPPGKLVLNTKHKRRTTRGSIIRVAATVRRVAGRPPENVKLETRFNNAFLRPLGPTTIRIPSVRTAVRHKFAFRVRKAGRMRVALHLASGTTNADVNVVLNSRR